jgi:hypothetical protein
LMAIWGVHFLILRWMNRMGSGEKACENIERYKAVQRNPVPRILWKENAFDI